MKDRKKEKKKKRKKKCSGVNSFERKLETKNTHTQHDSNKNMTDYCFDISSKQSNSQKYYEGMRGGGNMNTVGSANTSRAVTSVELALNEAG